MDRIRDANDIVEVINGYLPLKKKGREFVALCPFHNEKTPSFNVIPQKQIFYCFGCHKGGDVFKFLCEYENISYPEAIQRLAERVGIEIEFENSKESINRSIKEALLHTQEAFTLYWHEQLLRAPEAQVARDYLAQRGVSEQSIHDFRLGYSPLAWEDTPQEALRLKLDMNRVVESGLALAKEDQRHFYGRFRGRLMFPICDDQGRVIGFSGRVLYPDQDKMGKYVNSPETPLFHKGRIIFGLDRAKREILQKHSSIICEGQLDLIACHAAGFKNVVAPQGTAFTVDQARLLKRFAPEVVLCFDGDNAGQDASVKALDVLLAAGLNMKVALLPDQHDPDSLIKAHGAAAFGELIARSRDFFDFYLARLCQKHNKDSDLGRSQIVQSMGEALGKANQPLLSDTYAQKTAQLLGVSPQTVLDEFKRVKGSAPRSYPDADRETPTNLSPQGQAEEEEEEFIYPSQREEWLLKLFFMNEAEWEWISQCFQPEWVENEAVRRILERALDDYHAGQWSAHALLQYFQEGPCHEILCEALAQSEEQIPEPAQQLRELILSLRSRHCDHLLRTFNQRLQTPGLTLEEQLQLLQQKNRIRQIRSTPLF